MESPQFTAGEFAQVIVPAGNTSFTLENGAMPLNSASPLNPQKESDFLLEAGSAQQIQPELGRVWVLHGFANNRFCTRLLCKRLEAGGYDVVNWGYPSWRKSIEYHSDRLAAEVNAFLDRERNTPVHFVGHSMGAIIVRRTLLKRTDWPVGRAVLLGPPNGGADSAARWAPLLGKFFAPIRELSSKPGSYVRDLPPLRGVEFGVIAATYDHIVSWSNTQLAYQKDHLTIPSTHAGLLFRAEVANAVLHFLRHGNFKPASPQKARALTLS